MIGRPNVSFLTGVSSTFPLGRVCVCSVSVCCGVFSGPRIRRNVRGFSLIRKSTSFQNSTHAGDSTRSEIARASWFSFSLSPSFLFVPCFVVNEQGASSFSFVGFSLLFSSSSALSFSPVFDRQADY